MPTNNNANNSLLQLTQHFKHAPLTGRRTSQVPSLPLVALHQLHTTGRSQLAPDQDVEHCDQSHGQQEEQKRGHLEEVREELLHHLALLVAIHFDHTKGERLYQSHSQRHHPDHHDHADGTRQLGQGVREEGMTDGQVAFHGEGGDCQHGGIATDLCDKGVKDAAEIAIWRGIPMPDRVDLLGDATDQEKKVGHGQTEEVVVGGRVHGPVAGYNDARANVAEDTGDKDDRVDYDHWQDDVHGVVD